MMSKLISFILLFTKITPSYQTSENNMNMYPVETDNKLTAIIMDSHVTQIHIAQGKTPSSMIISWITPFNTSLLLPKNNYFFQDLPAAQFNMEINNQLDISDKSVKIPASQVLYGLNYNALDKYVTEGAYIII